MRYRRSRRDWRRAQTFPAARYFVQPMEDDLIWIGDGRWHLWGSPARDPRIRVLMDHLVVDDSLEGFLAFWQIERAVCLTDVVMRLVRTEIVSDAAVRAATVEQHEADEAAIEAEPLEGTP